MICVWAQPALVFSGSRLPLSNSSAENAFLARARGLLLPFPSAPMTYWPISTRVNKVDNDDESILAPTA
jgi:hypothetical protein